MYLATSHSATAHEYTQVSSLEHARVDTAWRYGSRLLLAHATLPYCPTEDVYSHTHTRPLRLHKHATPLSLSTKFAAVPPLVGKDIVVPVLGSGIGLPPKPQDLPSKETSAAALEQTITKLDEGPTDLRMCAALCHIHATHHLSSC